MKRQLQFITAWILAIGCLSHVFSSYAQVRTAPGVAQSVNSEAKANEATFYIYRPKKWKGTTKEPAVFIDGIEVARMDNGRYFIAKLEPGPHVLHMIDKNKNLAVDAVAGETYYFLITMERGEDRASHGVLRPSNAATTLAEIKKLKYLGRNKIRNHTIVMEGK